MNFINIKATITIISICSLIGTAIQHFTGFYWLTATLITMIALLINGLIASNEDLQPGGFDHQPGITDTKEAKAAQRKENIAQIIIILLLIIAAAWPYI